MKGELKSIVNVISGYNFRIALKMDEIGSNLVIQAKDVMGGVYIEDNGLARINFKNDKTNAFVKSGDIIMSVRGKFRAGLYIGKAQSIIASSSVYILRLINKNVNPEYLTIYLNSKLGQREIGKALTGAVVQTILRKDLENLNVIIPDLKKQQSIIDIYKNNILLQKKLDTKKQLINNITETVISKILK